jgi:hypothetical protein
VTPGCRPPAACERVDGFLCGLEGSAPHRLVNCLTERSHVVGVPELIVMTILAMIYALALWKIFSKAGFPGIMSLVMSLITLIPFTSIMHSA